MTTLEKVYPYALTTLSRVKARLQLTNNDSDPVLTRIINSVTDNIERMCGKAGMEAYPNDCHFVQKVYLNEIYTVNGRRQEKVILRNQPVLNAVVSATVTQGTGIYSAALQTMLTPALMNTVSPLISATNFIYGLPILGAGIAQGSYITGTDGAGNFTLNVPPQVSGTNVIVEVSGLLSFQWRSGTPSNPVWTPFIQDQSEIIEQGRAGIIRVYGQLPFIYSNMLRATYIAGYPTDWQNAGNGTTHRLPADLTNTCENICVRTFKRLKLAGQASESLQGATLSWRNDYDAEDKAVIANYTRVGQVF
jgi:hypothetical protein